MTQEQPGHIEIDDSGPVRVRFAPPQEWFTLAELRQFAAYLTLVADENEPSPEVDRLAEIIETAGLLRCNPKAAARHILAALGQPGTSAPEAGKDQP